MQALSAAAPNARASASANVRRKDTLRPGCKCIHTAECRTAHAHTTSGGGFVRGDEALNKHRMTKNDEKMLCLLFFFLPRFAPNPFFPPSPLSAPNLTWHTRSLPSDARWESDRCSVKRREISFVSFPFGARPTPFPSPTHPFASPPPDCTFNFPPPPARRPHSLGRPQVRRPPCEDARARRARARRFRRSRAAGASHGAPRARREREGCGIRPRGFQRGGHRHRGARAVRRGARRVGLALLASHSCSFAGKTPVDGSRYGPCGQSDTREWGVNPLVKTPIDDSQDGPCNQSDTRE
jgi:hypothetical protein